MGRFILGTSVVVVTAATCIAPIALADQPSHVLATTEHREAVFAARLIWSRILSATADTTPWPVTDGTQVVVWTGPTLESYALNGRLNWKSPSGFGAPLAVANGRVYAVDSQRHAIVAVDLKTGRSIWRSHAIADLYVDGSGHSRILVSSRGLALFDPGLFFANLKTGRVRAGEPEGQGLIFYPEAVQAARIVGASLYVAQVTEGGSTDTTVAQYDLTTGQRIWQSANDASQFWILDHTAIVADEPYPGVPVLSYSPIRLETWAMNGYASALPWKQATFSPDPPAKVVPVAISSPMRNYVAGQYFIIAANDRIYRYDLYQAPSVQSPGRIDTDDPILGMLDNGMLVIASKSALKLFNFAAKIPQVASVTRGVLRDTEPFPTFMPLGDAAAMMDAAGSLLIFDGGMRVADISASCRTLVAAVAVNAETIAAVCHNGSHQSLKLFGAPNQRQVGLLRVSRDTRR